MNCVWVPFTNSLVSWAPEPASPRTASSAVAKPALVKGSRDGCPGSSPIVVSCRFVGVSMFVT